ncbi:hypothetical protein E1B28_007665 [Marasmius oreades]|uniref:CCZ1/INTU/HSP4 first Longin domain-containing protein n=1 Tax=Marasmius oreades TaxID=181124 RepID=A0A9P7S203_9AGAR|nr:uncharacterized protein E1B28_007665 [Marasmius oreades]KAG7094044.1 hypothetical protein E1B28_007665 [Marasmius oreades]
MARVPPTLSYLTIYNPTLTATGSISNDDEDAEEQAQILFYTSKERATSRDTILRQVGLAKALANFSEMFNPGTSCESVHSQTRRMIMICPEPDFWIHVAVEVSKIPRAHTITKANSKGRGNEKQKEPAISYDYSDASVHDLALKADLMKGYEHFKLTHGSFTSILSTQGRTALELQLERFFIVWAWSWDLESGFEFGDHLGVPLHSTHTTIATLLDEFSSRIPDNLAPIFATPTHIILSKRYIDGRLPKSLSRYILSLVLPSPDSPGGDLDLESTLRLKKPPDPIGANYDGFEQEAHSQQGQNTNSFMGIPTGNLNMNVNVKWSWPGYLTFGKSAQKQNQNRPSLASSTSDEKVKEEQDVDDHRNQHSHPADAEIDRSALDDAISSEGVHVSHSVAQEDTHDFASADISNTPSTTSPPIPPKQFSSTGVHISDPLNPLLTKRRTVYYLTKPGRTISCISLDDNKDPDLESLDYISVQIDGLFKDIEKVTKDLPNSASSDGSIPVSKLLQQRDRHILALPHFTASTSDKLFSSKSQQLFNAQQFLESDLDVKEVFSRGQNPQHWHVGRKLKQGETVFMEVFSKESSLTDVDNGLAGIIRRMEGLVDI